MSGKIDHFAIGDKLWMDSPKMLVKVERCFPSNWQDIPVLSPRF